MDALIKFIVGVPLVVGTLFLLAMLMAFPIMWTWNYTFPAVFGLPTIDVWQALWGAVCIRLIFPSGTNVSK